ncbi:AfsR/SARP family transcriptional regulator [Nocardiopsis sp. Huas11]|uniref:AfsR/SARP family transcriptional regulator n=1 Tax=Nocardiopsis sp. Huas11 TaxID=2183912 RepID=UPI000EAF9CC4|nr:AfsR/SARP family transcriptional regulator [Nocardiopsis sp. Huas11]
MLGSVEVQAEGRRIRTGGPKRRTLLAALLLQPDTVVPDERLIDLVWGERPPRGARAQLQGHVHGLRKALGADTIHRSGCGYRAVVPEGATDLGVFERSLALAAADRAADRLDEAARTLRLGLALWTGPALSGVTPALAEHARPALEESRLRAREELYEVELRRGRAASVVAELRTLCADHPTRESLTGLLMSALHRSGRTGEALAAYAALRAVLAEELGTDPGAELRRLHLDLLHANEPGREGDGDREPPRTGRARVRPAELPLAVGRLVGRAAEMGALDRALDADRADGRSTTVFLLTGVAGVGKSALALHWGASVRDRFRDGQVYVDLHGSTPGRKPTPTGDALRQLLRSLGVDPGDLPTDACELAKLFRSVTADQCLLFLLDDADSVEQVAPLLAGGRGSAVLVTSRNDLTGLVAFFGAHPVRLDVLTRESAMELFAGVAGVPAVDAAAVAGIVEECGYLPLSVRLAAATLAVRTLYGDRVRRFARGGTAGAVDLSAGPMPPARDPAVC